MDETTTIVNDHSAKYTSALAFAGLGLMAAAGVAAACMLALRLPEWSAAAIAESQVISQATMPEKVEAWRSMTWLLVATFAALPAAAWLGVVWLLLRVVRKQRPAPVQVVMRYPPAALGDDAGMERWGGGRGGWLVQQDQPAVRLDGVIMGQSATAERSIRR